MKGGMNQWRLSRRKAVNILGMRKGKRGPNGWMAKERLVPTKAINDSTPIPPYTAAKKETHDTIFSSRNLQASTKEYSQKQDINSNRAGSPKKANGYLYAPFETTFGVQFPKHTWKYLF